MAPLRRVKLTQLNAHLVCVLCSGYFVDATTIIECLHTFCKTCIVRYLQTSSFCPICDVQVHKTRPLLSLREDRTLQDVVFKLVPGLFHSEMKRRFCFYKEHPEGGGIAGGDKTEQSLRERRHFFHVDDQISLSLEHVSAPPCPTQNLVHNHLVKPLKVSNGQLEKQHKSTVQEEKNEPVSVKDEEGEGCDGGDSKVVHKRYLRCPAAVQVSHIEKFVRLKYNLSPKTHRVEIMYGGDCLMGELTLLDVVYMYKWTEDAPLRLMFTVTVLPQSRKRAKSAGSRAPVKTEPSVPPCKVAKLQASPPVSAPCQDSTKGDTVAREDCKDEKLNDTVKILPPLTIVTDKPNITTTAASVSASLCTETKNSSVTQTSIMSCGTGAVQLPSARGRPALTTTTPATSTPRVALAHMPSQTPPATVPLSVVGSSAPAAVAPAFTHKTPFIPAMTSAPSVMIQTSQPVVNGLRDCGLKQIRGTSPNLLGNKMPQPIIPTRPRLGRPPNSSRINAAKMRPPAPRMSIPNMDIRARPQGTKVYPGGMVTRPNPVVSASLNVQNRQSSISEPPAKLAASKVSIKRSNDGMQQDGGVSPIQSPPVSIVNSSTSSVSITMTQSSTTSHDSPIAQPPSPSQVSTSKASTNIMTTVPATKTTASPHQSTLAMERQTQKLCLPQTQGAQGVQRTNHQSPRLPLNPSLRPTVPQVPRHPGPQGGQRQPPPQSSQQTTTPTSYQRPLMQPNQKTAIPQQTQGNQKPSSPQVMQHPTPQEGPRPPTGLPSAGSTAGHGVQKFPLSSSSQRLSNLGAQRSHLLPAPQRPATPASTRPSNSPASLRPPSTPAPHRLPNSPAPHRLPSSPAPHRQTSSPAPHRPPCSQAPHRQAGSTTPRPHSAPTTPSGVASPSPRSTPSPRCASTPSPGGMSAPAAVRDYLPPLSISSPASSVATSSVTNVSSQGSKPCETHSYGRVVPSSGNGATQTQPTKTVSPGGGKTAPKSPGRSRGASNSPSILSIAQSLANRHLQQQRTTITTTATSSNSTAVSIGTTQMNAHQPYATTTTTPVYPGPVASSLVPLAAAYMASTYGDATPDVTAMRNLITLSQTAACIRELNLAAMVKNLPRATDPVPIDLSPTSKAAPQTPITNGRLQVSSSSSTTATKTTNSKSPTKTSRTSTTANAPTISPPTPEVTITKLPNTPASTTSNTTPTSSMTKTTFGSVKLGSSNTNTVSITKRPASSKISVAKSPANASVRQIPNPSFVRHQSEARNNNNVSKPPSSSASHTVSTKNVSTKQSGGGGRPPGNSPLKETGPLPETSSILKIENLTRSLPAPAAAADPSHGLNFF